MLVTVPSATVAWAVDAVAGVAGSSTVAVAGSSTGVAGTRIPRASVVSHRHTVRYGTVQACKSTAAATEEAVRTPAEDSTGSSAGW